MDFNVHLTLTAEPKLFEAFAAIAALLQQKDIAAPRAPEPAAAEIKAPEPPCAAPDAALEAVMREARAKAEAGFRAQVVALVSKYGGNSISKIPQEMLGAFIADVRALKEPA